ncbi:MAG: hypothetical protein HY336_01545 [Candidatus Doudnabacteria bacterium]|nr:hypothetical protein [Candidatus Doudnabacteria bacterium]
MAYIAILFASSLVLLIGGIRRYVLRALYWSLLRVLLLYQQITGRAPAPWITRVVTWIRNAASAATGPIVSFLRWLGVTLAAVVIINIVAIGYGNGWVLWVEAVVLGTICYIFFSISRLWDGKAFAIPTLVFYGMAVLGLLFPDWVRVNPRLFVIGTLLIPMIKVATVLINQRWIKAVAVTSLVIIAVVAGAYVAYQQVGYVQLKAGRTAFVNNTIKAQANAEWEVHPEAERKLSQTVRSAQQTLLAEMDKDNPDPNVAAKQFIKLNGQKRVMGVMHSISPAPEAPRARRSIGLNEEAKPAIIAGLIFAALAAALIFKSRKTAS